jgi:hypothetical protein
MSRQQPAGQNHNMKVLNKASENGAKFNYAKMMTTNQNSIPKKTLKVE